MVFITVVALLLVYFAVQHFHKSKNAPPKEAPLVFQPINDKFWLKLNRRRSDKFRAQLAAAPQALMIRETHYAFNPRNGMGKHYGWIDGRLADLHIGLSELVGYAYGKDYAQTEFPKEYTQGHWTNNYDVICTLTNQPRKTFQAAAKNSSSSNTDCPGIWRTGTRMCYCFGQQIPNCSSQKSPRTLPTAGRFPS